MTLPFAARWEVTSLRSTHGSFVEAAKVKPLTAQPDGDWWVERPVPALPARHVDRVRRRWWLASQLVSPVWPTLLDAGEDGDVPWAVIESPGRRTDGTFPVADPTLATKALRWLALGVAEAEALLLLHCASPHLSVTPAAVGTDDRGHFRLQLAALDATPDEGLISTPHLWAWTPEQLTGQPASARSNVFSLAWLLHVMLTGRSPYGDFSNGKSESHARDALRPLVAAQQLKLSLPASHSKLEPVLRRALSANAGQRFPSSSAFAEALVPFSNATTPTRPPRRMELVTVPVPPLDPAYEVLPTRLEQQLLTATDDAPAWAEAAERLASVHSPRAAAIRDDATPPEALWPSLTSETLKLEWKRGYVRAVTAGPHGKTASSPEALGVLLQHPSLRLVHDLTLAGPLAHAQPWIEALARHAPQGLRRVTVQAVAATDPTAVDLAFRYPRWVWVWGSGERGLFKRLFGG